MFRGLAIPRIRLPGRAERIARSAAARIAGAYFIAGVLWIALSDAALEWVVRDVALLARLQTLKGWAFIAFTAALLFALVRRETLNVQRTEERLRSVLESMSDAVLLVDQQLRITEVNRAATRLFGAVRGELATPLEAFCRRFVVQGADASEALAEAARRALSGGAAHHHELVVRPPGRDETLHLSVVAAPVRDRDDAVGPADYAVLVLRDESPLRQLERLRNDFLAVAAHEFKTPLAIIKAYAQLLARWEAERESARARVALQTIDRQVDRLTHLIQNVLETTRLLAPAALHLKRRETDMRALVAESIARVQPISPRHRITLEAGDSAIAFVDAERLSQVVATLLDNAVRYSPNGGAVHLSLDARSDEVEVSVADEGIGIAEERRAGVFDRFFQPHEGRTDDLGGLGLGLHLARGLVERHGGRIWFESTPGAGSTFHFTVPVGAAHE